MLMLMNQQFGSENASRMIGDIIAYHSIDMDVCACTNR